jgi:glycosyltransferase involved in cell wall biosynthesis
MYDTAARRANRLFLRVLSERNVRIVSFCRALSRVVGRDGVSVIDCTYYPDPSAVGEASEGDGELRVFLWDRGEVGFERLKALLGHQRVGETILRLAPDPGLHSSRPSAADMERYRVRLICGPLSRDEHLRLLAHCNVFVAPRELEGIGLANLEAMAMGLAVVAPDRPTMNEYITHGVNGYLYDPRRPRAIDLCDASNVGRRARADVKRGHAEWTASLPRMIAEVLKPVSPRRAPSPGTTAAAFALTGVERAKAYMPPGPRAAVASALRFYRP